MDRFEECLLNMDEFWTSILTNGEEEKNTISVRSVSTSSSIDLEAPSQAFISIYQTPLSTTLRNSSRLLTTNLSTAKKKNISIYENSPITTVINSSMGSAVSKLRKQQNTINTQKERIEQMERELDDYVENCDRLKQDIIKLEALKKTLV